MNTDSGNTTRGAFKNRVKLKLSSAKPEVIRVRVQAGVNPMEW